MRLGSVCRHLKIAGRVSISQFFHVTSSNPESLQHIRQIQRQAMAAEIKDKGQDRDRNIDRKMCLLHRPLPLSHFRWLPLH
jgi:hypothetical protein